MYVPLKTSMSYKLKELILLLNNENVAKHGIESSTNL